jgi:hypothetical protein
MSAETGSSLANSRTSLTIDQRQGLAILGKERNARDGREGGSTRCKMEKLSAGKFHDVPSINES